MNSASIGKYVPGNSFVHKIDPRLKLAYNITLIILVFLTRSFVVQGLLFLPVIIAFIFSGLRLIQLLKILRTTVFIGIFIFLINLVVLQTRTQDVVYWSWWIFTLSNFVIIQTVLIASRIFTMIIATTLLTATTKPMGLTRAIEDLLFPLKLFFVPVHIIAMIISIALRFIPTLLSETQRIMKAQASRGVDFRNGNIKQKMRSMVTLIIPLFVSAFAKAEDLGNAMETRGYDPYQKRTRYRSYPFKLRDALVAIFLIATIVFVAYFSQYVFILP